jgi:putative nucleotidyltransferase with HDIG domain
MSDELPRISPDRIVVGLYVHLDLGWMDHPFSFNHFKVKTQEQIDTIRTLGLATVRYDPKKSDVAAPQASAADADAAAAGRVPPAAPAAAAPASPSAAADVQTPPVELPASIRLAQAEKRRRVETNRRLREKFGECERDFAKAAGVMRNIARNLLINPQAAVAGANQLADSMLETLLAESELAIHLMNDKVAGEETYNHSLNVSMLVGIVGKSMELDPAIIRIATLGALFHDIGKQEVPDRVLQKKDALTSSEAALLQRHCTSGAELGRRLGLPAEVVAVIAQHHETMDGHGYPAGLQGDEISMPARLVAVVNAYDNLCNPLDVAAAMTPHEALSMMYARQRSKFDVLALSKIVQSLGVYPPGTVVLLSNDMTGMVLSVNPARPLRPLVMVYDPEVPKRDAIILDLEGESDVNIGKALRPGHLPREISDYLSPRRRTTYYFDAALSGDA